MDLKHFVDEELYPALWENLDRVFPEMEFKFFMGKWRSPKNLDGSSPRKPRKDKTIVKQSYFKYAIENGEGGNVNLITLFKEHNRHTNRIEAIKEMAKICNLTVPEGADAKTYEEARERREQLAQSYGRQRQALFSPEGAEVLKYLKEVRGYSEELIKEMGLGYLSPQEARNLEEKCKAGIAWKAEEYPLSIAYFSNGEIMGFKCRCITPIEGKSRYMNTQGLGTEGMNKNPFGLVPQRLTRGSKNKDIILVEGELDALHAIALGLPNVIATSGGEIKEETARALKENGYRNVVILLDNDIAGQKYTAKSIQTIDKVGLNAFVATLPDAKDTDEYLGKHGIEELREVAENAYFAGRFLYKKELDKFLSTRQSEKDFFNFLEEYYKLASGYRDPVKRAWLLEYLHTDFEEVNIQSIEKGIKERIELQIVDQDKKKKREEAAKALSEASTALRNGEGSKAADQTKKALETLKESEAEAEYSFILEDNTEDIWKQYRETQGGLATNITLNCLEGGNNVEYDLSFPPGAISVIGAQTNHGKSKVLLSIALDALENLEEGETILYITYEENELNVNKQFLNAYANLYVKPKGENSSNLKAISKYLSSGNTEELSKDNREAFLEKEKEWKKVRSSQRIKIVKPEDNYLQTLLGLIRFAVKNLSVKVVFIDYVQEIYVRDWKKYSRTDELKEAMVELDAIAQRINVPIVMAAQLNRDANSPLALYNRYIADSAWIERKASEILLIWSNARKPEGEDRKNTEKRVEEEIEKHLGELNLGTEGKLYVKLTKSRIIPPGAHAIIPINGATGRVGGKHKEKKLEEPKQRKIYGGSPLSKAMERNKQEPYRKDSDNEIEDAPF